VSDRARSELWRYMREKNPTIAAAVAHEIHARLAKALRTLDAFGDTPSEGDAATAQEEIDGS
jgi:hypothetical protein